MPARNGLRRRLKLLPARHPHHRRAAGRSPRARRLPACRAPSRSPASTRRLRSAAAPSAGASGAPTSPATASRTCSSPRDRSALRPIPNKVFIFNGVTGALVDTIDAAGGQPAECPTAPPAATSARRWRSSTSRRCPTSAAARAATARTPDKICDDRRHRARGRHPGDHRRLARAAASTRPTARSPPTNSDRPADRPRLRHRRQDPRGAQAHRHAGRRPPGSASLAAAARRPGVRAHDGLPAGHAAVRGPGEREQRHRRRPVPAHRAWHRRHDDRLERRVTNVNLPGRRERPDARRLAGIPRRRADHRPARGTGTSRCPSPGSAAPTPTATATATGVALEAIGPTSLLAGRPHRRPRRRRQARHRHHRARLPGDPWPGSAAPGSECKPNTTAPPAATAAPARLDVSRRGHRRHEPATILDTTRHANAPTCRRDRAASPTAASRTPTPRRTAGGEYGGNMFRVGDIVGDDGFPDYIIPFRGVGPSAQEPGRRAAGLNMGSAYLFNGRTGALARTIVSPEPQIRARRSAATSTPAAPSATSARRRHRRHPATGAAAEPAVRRPGPAVGASTAT